jgi:hypothetical protein
MSRKKKLIKTKKPYTLDDLEEELMQDPEFKKEYEKEEGLEPTAEEEVVETNCGNINIVGNSYNDDAKTCTVDLYGFKQVIIKYKGKEIVITRDDFADYSPDTSDCLGYTESIKFRATYPESQYPEGSRMWAFEMLDKGKKVRLGYFAEDELLYLDGEEGDLCLEDIDGNPCDFGAGVHFPKDGWELYEEEEKPKTMTIGEAMQNNRKFNFTDKEYDFTKNSTQRFDAEDILILYKNYDYQVLTRED